MPPIIVGTASLGSVLPWFRRRHDFAYLDAVCALGLKAFDTAAVYQLGGSERSLGAWMQARRNREDLLLISKGLHPAPFSRARRFHPAALRADVEGSLRRLGTERIDLYLLHRDSPDEPFEPVMDALAALVQAGKIGAFGVSNWSHTRLSAARAYCRARNQPAPVVSSPHFSLFEWNVEPWPGCVSIAGSSGAEARAYYAAERLPVLAWSPLGAGFFSTRPSVAASPACQRVYGSSFNHVRRRAVHALAARRGVPAAAVALAYVLHQPFPASVIVSASGAQRMIENLCALDLVLSREELDSLCALDIVWCG